VRDAKILINILQVGNQVNAIVVATPEYQVSASLEVRLHVLISYNKYLLKINQKTLHNFAAAILLSSKISAYKGAVPTNTLLVRVHIPFALHRGNLISEYTSEKSLRSAPRHREQAG
jgi:hypothetical protein